MKLKAILLVASLSLAASANATLFTVTWDGAQFGNRASAIGHFNINTAAFPDLAGVQNFNALPNADFQLLDLTVSGASSGNGSFVESDFSAFYFAAYSPLNYSQELVGQAMGNSCNFGSFTACYGGGSGDFNLFSAAAGAPTGTFFFQLTTTGGDSIGVTSIKASVPEPASWALMITGFGMVGGALRSRRKGVVVA